MARARRRQPVVTGGVRNAISARPILMMWSQVIHALTARCPVATCFAEPGQYCHGTYGAENEHAMPARWRDREKLPPLVIHPRRVVEATTVVRQAQTSRLANLRDLKIWDKAMDRTWRSIAVEMVRVDALVILDRLIEVWSAMDDHDAAIDRLSDEILHGEMGEFEDIPDLVQLRTDHVDARGVLVNALSGPDIRDAVVLAKVDYKLRFNRARGDRLWITRRTSDSNRGASCDVVCRFCACTIVLDGRLGVNYSYDERVYRHTVTCALCSLGGTREPTPPGASPSQRDLDFHRPDPVHDHDQPTQGETKP